MLGAVSVAAPAEPRAGAFRSAVVFLAARAFVVPSQVGVYLRVVQVLRAQRGGEEHAREALRLQLEPARDQQPADEFTPTVLSCLLYAPITPLSSWT